VRKSPNVSGQAYSLTVLTPVLEGRESALARRLNGLGSGPQSPLAGVPGTHFARWVVIDDVVYEGRGERDHLALARLLFTSNFDGALDAHLAGLGTGLGDTADAIWGECVGYPGRADAAAFAAYMRAHQIESSLFFGAYGDRTVAEVQRSLAARHQVMEFALAAQGLGAAALQAAFVQAFPT
jgi:hypothetical protein